jgi:hypothetical protein
MNVLGWFCDSLALHSFKPSSHCHACHFEILTRSSPMAMLSTDSFLDRYMDSLEEVTL